MALIRDITRDDVKGIVLPPIEPLWEALIATAIRAMEIYDEAEKAATKPSSRPKRRRSPEKAAAAAAAVIALDDGTRQEPKKKKRKAAPPITRHARPAAVNYQHIRPLPEEFRRAIDEVASGRGAQPPEARLLIQKALYKTDLSGGHNRLSIPINHMVCTDFLTEKESDHLEGYHGKKKKNYLKVTILEPSLATETAKLTRWDMPKAKLENTSVNYVINGSWRHIAERNRLKPGTEVQLWSFRVREELFLALVRL